MRPRGGFKFIGFGVNGRAKIEAYKPGRKDSRVNEARAMLSVRRTLEGLSADSLRCQFNLRIETAQALLRGEQKRRVG